jgi:hypothetical protein
MVNFLWDRGRPRALVAQKASGRKLFVLRTGAGEGARGPSKSGYQRPNLEFQTDPLPQWGANTYHMNGLQARTIQLVNSAKNAPTNQNCL